MRLILIKIGKVFECRWMTIPPRFHTISPSNDLARNEGGACNIPRGKGIDDKNLWKEFLLGKLVTSLSFQS